MLWERDKGRRKELGKKGCRESKAEGVEKR